MSNIYLIGLPGSGKTFIGKKLSEKLNYDFIDMNTLIEKESLMFIDEIIERYDLNTIYKTEEKLLKNLKTKEKSVIALTDGVVLNRKNKKLLNGIIVYLDTDELVLEKRLKKGYPKKIFEKVTLNTLINERFLKYSTFSTHIVNNNHDNYNLIIDEIIAFKVEK